MEVEMVGILEVDHYPVAGAIAQHKMNVAGLPTPIGRRSEAVVGQQGIVSIGRVASEAFAKRAGSVPENLLLIWSALDFQLRFGFA